MGLKFKSFTCFVVFPQGFLVYMWNRRILKLMLYILWTFPFWQTSSRHFQNLLSIKGAGLIEQYSCTEERPMGLQLRHKQPRWLPLACPFVALIDWWSVQLRPETRGSAPIGDEQRASRLRPVNSPLDRFSPSLCMHFLFYVSFRTDFMHKNPETSQNKLTFKWDLIKGGPGFRGGGSLAWRSAGISLDIASLCSIISNPELVLHRFVARQPWWELLGCKGLTGQTVCMEAAADHRWWYSETKS